MPPTLHHVNENTCSSGRNGVPGGQRWVSSVLRESRCRRRPWGSSSERQRAVAPIRKRQRATAPLDQVRLPAGFEPAEREVEAISRSEGLASQMEPGFRWGAVFLLRVAPPAGRHDVLPRCDPPRERGITWSRFSAAAPQYWQRQASRANTARRVSGACGRYGTRTYLRSRTTDGASMTIRSEWKTMPFDRTTSAFSLRTSTTARRAGTTANGESDALRTSARPMDRV